jgi:diacylglycerol O-acyltransferase
MRQLSEADTSFIYLETNRNPLHIGCLLLLDDADAAQKISLQTLSQLLAGRLHLVETLRQKIVQLPLKLDNPYWADDMDFSLERHLHEVALPSPGRFNTLMKLVSDNLSTPLQKDRPLWEVTLITGLADIAKCPEATCAVLFKVHQTMIDSATGGELIGVLLDTTEVGKKLAPIPTWTPKPPPSKVHMIGHAYGNALAVPKRWAVFAKDAASATFYQALMHQFRKLALPAALFNTPVAPFNQAVDNYRELDGYSCSFDKIRHLKQKASGVSTNAILMTLCSEALHRYLGTDGTELKGSLTALTPVSVRSKRIDSPTGSQLSAMIVSLATDEPDLAKRLFRINHVMKSSEVYSKAVAADRLTKLAPTALLGLAARTYSEFQIAQSHKPVFNLPVTNIPGPSNPFYLAGARVTANLTSTPLFDGLGLSITILTYCDKAYISLTACPKAVPDLDRLTTQFAPALEALAAALENTDWHELKTHTELTTKQNVSLWAALLDDSQALIQKILSQWTGRDRRQKAREDEAIR